MIEFLQTQKQTVQVLPELTSFITPQITNDYTAWLQVPWTQDAFDTAQLFNKSKSNVDLVIVDHYSLGIDWERQIKSKLDCQLFAIDDLVREHAADLILDQTLLRKSCEYRHANQDTNILAGCDYALIKPDFVTLREDALKKKINMQTPRLLLTMGAIDQFNVTLKVLNVFATQATEQANVTVLLSRNAPHYEDITAFCHQHEWITHIDFVDDMPSFMHKHDFAVGAPGSTTWERTCLGIPSILIPLAENQQVICQNMLAADAAIALTIDDISSHFVAAYKQLISKAVHYQAQNLTLCDGLGLNRTLLAVEKLSKNDLPI